MLQNINDAELLHMLATDNVLAFEEIYKRYSKNMFLYAMRIFKKKEVCEDIVQNVFTDFWAKRKKVKITNLKSYLFQSVKFQIFNHIRNQKMSNEDLSRLEIIDISANLSQKMEFDELQRLINNQISRLPERCKLIFMLSRFEHKSNKAIASDLGISIQAVKNQISKAIKQIRRNLSSEEVVLYFLLISY
jgi:RNA polymerase sigma-70 factor (ECF subfamily)